MFHGDATCVTPPTKAPGMSLTSLRPDAPGVSPRADAEALRVHGISEPNEPATAAEAVTVTQSPSLATPAVAPSPAMRLTMPCTSPVLSPRARPRAPALAASSNRSWVIPAAPAASKKANRKITAGRATANSAVTAPRSFCLVDILMGRGAASIGRGTGLIRRGTGKVMARTTRCEPD